MTRAPHFGWSAGRIGADFIVDPDGPVRCVRLGPDAGGSLVREHAIVDVFTAGEQRIRSAQAFVRSAVGERLRYLSHRDEGDRLVIVQQDLRSGLEVDSVLRARSGAEGIQWQHTVRNAGDRPVVLTAVTSFLLRAQVGGDARLLWGESEWLAEGRWHDDELRTLLPDLGLDVHGQDGRGTLKRASVGAWSTGGALPTGALVRRDGVSLAWQVETSAGWSWELTQLPDSVVLSVSGPTDLDHQFAHRLQPGESFTSVPVGTVLVDGGRDEVFGALTRYRRSLRVRRPIDDDLPVIYNDYMNTLMGAPSTEALLPLIDAAADAGVEVFCIDAGWFTDADEYWASIGVWAPAPHRFTGGLGEVIDTIHGRGLRSGLWWEPEVVGVRSPAARELPDEAFFQRFGERVCEAERYHLDLRHPAARAHLDTSIDRLVEEFGISYVKLDYNIDPGAGTDLSVLGAGAGLLQHTVALREWLLAAQRRHQGVVFENCASGAMRMDYALLSVAHLQSTSDQQDALRYAPIAAAAPASILPEQAGNWAYPAASMTEEETVFTLVNGLAGRLMLSGFLHRLTLSQRALVDEAVAVSRQWRGPLSAATPEWPLGLPGWDDEVIALALRTTEGTLLYLWSRAESAQEVVLSLRGREVRPIFPGAAPMWRTTISPDGLRVVVPAGPCAQVVLVSD